MKKGELKLKHDACFDEAKEILENIVTGFKEGTVCIEKGNEFIVLKPGKHITVEIEAVQKKDKEKLIIELNWRNSTDETKTEIPFKISSKAPVVEEQETPEHDQKSDEE